METLLRKSRNIENCRVINIGALDLPSAVRYDSNDRVRYAANKVFAFSFTVVANCVQDCSSIRKEICRYFYTTKKKIVIVENTKSRWGKYLTRVEIYLTVDKLPQRNEMELYISDIVDMFDSPDN